MKISLSHGKLHQLYLYSNFTCSFRAILKLPGKSPTNATLELTYLSGWLMPFAPRGNRHISPHTFFHNILKMAYRNHVVMPLKVFAPHTERWRSTDV